jgi:hypothetical protein
MTGCAQSGDGCAFSRDFPESEKPSYHFWW